MNTILIENKLILDMLKNAFDKFDELEIIGAHSCISELIFSDDIELLIIDPAPYKLNDLIELTSHIKSMHSQIKIAITPMFYDEFIYNKLLAADIDIVLWKGAKKMEFQNAFRYLKQGRKYYTKENEQLN